MHRYAGKNPADRVEPHARASESLHPPRRLLLSYFRQSHPFPRLAQPFSFPPFSPRKPAQTLSFFRRCLLPSPASSPLHLQSARRDALCASRATPRVVPLAIPLPSRLANRRSNCRSTLQIPALPPRGARDEASRPFLASTKSTIFGTLRRPLLAFQASFSRRATSSGREKILSATHTP